MKGRSPFAGVSSPSRVRQSALGCVLGALLALGCSKQAEGERCDTNNNNEDCESGLQCTPLRTLGRGTVGAVCCPDNDPSVEICQRLELDEFEDDETNTPTDPEPEPTASQSTDSGATSPGANGSDAATAGGSAEPGDAATPAALDASAEAGSP